MGTDLVTSRKGCIYTMTPNRTTMKAKALVESLLESPWGPEERHIRWAGSRHERWESIIKTIANELETGDCKHWEGLTFDEYVGERIGDLDPDCESESDYLYFRNYALSKLKPLANRFNESSDKPIPQFMPRSKDNPLGYDEEENKRERRKRKASDERGTSTARPHLGRPGVSARD